MSNGRYWSLSRQNFKKLFWTYSSEQYQILQVFHQICKSIIQSLIFFFSLKKKNPIYIIYDVTLMKKILVYMLIQNKIAIQNHKIISNRTLKFKT